MDEWLKIGDLARQSGLTQRMLRHYEDLGILAPGRSGGGTRQYSGDDLRIARLARLMRELEIPLDTIAAIAGERRGHATGDRSSAAVAGLLDDLAARLEAQAEKARALHDEVLRAVSVIARCKGCTRPPSRQGCPECPVNAEAARNDIAALIWQDMPEPRG